MDGVNEIKSTRALIGTLEQRVEREKSVSLGEVFEAMGHRSFGPLLLVAGLIMAAPGVGDVPGVPTMVGTVVFLIAVQIVFGRRHFWLPAWVLGREVSDQMICKTIRWLRTPARWLDQISNKRLAWLTRGAGVYGIALTCIAIALATPAMEVVLFAANVAGLGLALFGLALVAHDGLLALCGYALTASTAGAISYYIL